MSKAKTLLSNSLKILFLTSNNNFLLSEGSDNGVLSASHNTDVVTPA